MDYPYDVNYNGPMYNEYVEDMDMDMYDQEEDDSNQLYVDPCDTIEGLWENRLEMKGPKSEIKRFIRENSTETSMLTLHAQNGQTKELPKLWVNVDEDTGFQSDAFDVEWVEPLNTLLFRTVYVVPDIWINMKSIEYPRVHFDLVYADNKENESHLYSVKNGKVLREERGDYCKYWEPYCENCERQIAKVYNMNMYCYYCDSCNALIEQIRSDTKEDISEQ